jgi:hypothetical protein
MAEKKVKKNVFAYAMGKLHKAIVFQVLEQNVPAEAIKSKVGEFEIRSTSHPELRLNEGHVYIRGTNEDGHFRVDVEYFDSNEERDITFDSLIATFAKWGEKHGIEIL